MDQIDRTILGCLEQDARMSLKELSKQCFISAPAVSSRIAHLKEHGYITGFHAAVDCEKLGYPIKAFVTLVPCAKRQRRILPLRQRMQERRRMRLRNRQVFADFDLPF